MLQIIPETLDLEIKLIEYTSGSDLETKPNSINFLDLVENQ